MTRLHVILSGRHNLTERFYKQKLSRCSRPAQHNSVADGPTATHYGLQLFESQLSKHTFAGHSASMPDRLFLCNLVNRFPFPFL